jgi:hypothetical protein
MDHLHLPLFLLNIPLILLDASLGYHLVPRLVSAFSPDDSDEAGGVARATRRLLPAVVALYMFFNCFGYFQARTLYLLMVFGLVLADLALQLVLRRKARSQGDERP